MLFKDLQNVPEVDFTKDFTELDYCGQKIKVYKTISTRDKYDLVWATLQQSRENLTYNEITQTMFFHLNLIYLYTDLVFEPDDKLDEFELYDKLNRCGLLRQIISLIPASEYEWLATKIDNETRKQEKVNNSTVTLVQSLINDLPRQVEAAQRIVDNFDPEKFEAVKKFAEAANGNRNITTNEPVPAETPEPKKKIIKMKKANGI